MKFSQNKKNQVILRDRREFSTGDLWKSGAKNWLVSHFRLETPPAAKIGILPFPIFKMRVYIEKDNETANVCRTRMKNIGRSSRDDVIFMFISTCTRNGKPKLQMFK